MKAHATTALTVRLPTALYEKGKALAEQQNMSLNELLIAALGTVVSRQQQEALFAAFSEVGADADLNNVDFAMAAQREVLDGSDHSRTVIDHDA